MMTRRIFALIFLAALTASACHKNTPPVVRPMPTPPPPPTVAAPPPNPPPPVREPIPPEPLASDAVASRSLDDLNRDSPLKPVFFELDSNELTDAGRSTLDADAAVLKKYATWVITIEGHCDERGTPEYNLALG